MPQITVKTFVKEWSKKKQIEHYYVDGVLKEEREYAPPVDTWEWKLAIEERVAGYKSILQGKNMVHVRGEQIWLEKDENEMQVLVLDEPYSRPNMQRVYEWKHPLHFCLRFLRNCVVCALVIVLFPLYLIPSFYIAFAVIIDQADFLMGIPCGMIEFVWFCITSL